MNRNDDFTEVKNGNIKVRNMDEIKVIPEKQYRHHELFTDRMPADFGLALLPPDIRRTPRSKIPLPQIHDIRIIAIRTGEIFQQVPDIPANPGLSDETCVYSDLHTFVTGKLFQAAITAPNTAH
jgi:hypothetical protein